MTISDNLSQQWVRQVNKDLALLKRHRHPHTNGVSLRDTPVDDLTEVVPVDESVAAVVDQPAPVVPSAPMTTTTMASVTVAWDGYGAGGEAMPSNLAYVVVHRSPDGPDFEPEVFTQAAVLQGEGAVTFADQPYDVPTYYRLVMHTTSGETSAPSAATVGVAVQVATTDVDFTAMDIDDGTISTAITSANGKNTITHSTVTPNVAGTTNGDVWFQRNVTTGVVTGQWEWDGDSWEPRLLASAVIANLDVGKLTTGELAAGGRIIAGPEVSSHAEMTSTGFMAYIDDPIDGVPNLAVRMGSADNDLFSIADGTGTTLASVDDRGHGNFRGISIGQDAPVYEVDTDSGDTYLAEGLEVYGREFLDYLNERSRGIVAFASATNQTWNGVGNTELPLYEMAFDGDPEREFWFHIDPLIFDPTAVARFALLTRFTTDGTQPTITSPIMRFVVGSSPDAGAVSLGLDVTGVFSLYTRILLSAVCYTTSQSVNILTGSNTVTRTAVYDMGRRLPDADNSYISRWSGANTGVPIKKTYVKEYLSTGSGTYRGTGFKRTDTTDVVQGYNSFNGDGEGLWVFPSMTSDLSGSTVNKIEVYCYANHWYYNSGGTALIKVHNYSAPPASSPAMTTAVSSAKWPKPGGRWVTLPSSTYAGFKAGTYKGFGMGPSGGTNLTYYGRFNGSGARIKVTYTK